MSENTQESIKSFFQKAMNDAGLMDQLIAAASLPEDDALDRIAQIAGTAGYDFTTADLGKFSRSGAGELTLVEDGELSDQQLDGVAGGGSCWSKLPGSNNCLFMYLDNEDLCMLNYACTSKKSM